VKVTTVAAQARTALAVPELQPGYQIGSRAFVLKKDRFDEKELTLSDSLKQRLVNWSMGQKLGSSRSSLDYVKHGKEDLRVERNLNVRVYRGGKLTCDS